jgi:V8-like Glu-specific endopeptidase
MNIKTLIIATIILYAANSNAAEAIKVYDAEKITSIKNYWTQERIKQVVPLPHPKLNAEEMKKLISQKQRKEFLNQPIQVIEESDLGLGIPQRANINQSPYSKGGVLLFTKQDNQQYLCSAQFVGQSNILLTAAHCVRNGKTGEWYDNFVFFRAYDNGGGEKFVAKCLVANNKWFDPAINYQYDYAFIQTNTHSSNGWLGLMKDIPYTIWTAIGYPENYGDNKYMYEVRGNKGITSDGVIEMRNNPMRHGNSGGAWISDKPMSSSGSQYAIGLNSFHSDAYPGSEFGPVFDDEFMLQYQKAVNNCGR